MSRDYKLYLNDIQNALNRIQLLMEGLDETQFLQAAVAVDGILFNLIIIGEAAKNIPPVIRDMMPEIGWSEIGRFRDFVTHHYFGLRMERVWDIVQTDLPELRQQLDQLLKLLEKQNE